MPGEAIPSDRPFGQALAELKALPTTHTKALLVRADYASGQAKAVVAYKAGDTVQLGAEFTYSQETRGWSAGGSLLFTWD